MDLRHQLGAMSVMVLGGVGTHPWYATERENPIPTTIPVEQSKKQPTTYSYQPLCQSTAGKKNQKELQWCVGLKKKLYVINFFKRISVAHSS